MFEITGITRTDGRPNKSGAVILAFFDLQFPGLLLQGCALVRYKNGNMTVWPPKVSTQSAQKGRVVFTDKSLFFKIRDAAELAFIRMGGDVLEHGEAIPL